MSIKLANFFARDTSQCPELQVCWSNKNCWDSGEENPSTATCFRTVFGLWICGAFLVCVAEVQGRKKKFKKFKKVVLTVRQTIEETVGDLSTSFRVGAGISSSFRVARRSSRGGGGGLGLGGDGTDSVGSSQGGDMNHSNGVPEIIKTGGDDDDDDEEDEGELAFVTTLRTESNFIKNNTDPTMKLPNAYTVEYEPRGVEQTVLPMTGFFSDTWYLAMKCNLLISVFLGSAGWAMLCSGFSTWLWILIDYEQSCGSEAEYIQKWVDAVGDSLTLVRNDYEFYPVFLLIGYIGYVVHRWREFMVNCHECQAKLHDVALFCGGGITGTPSQQVRRKLYRIYRYINVVHALCYKSVSPTVGPLELDLEFISSLGILEMDEAEELMILGNKKRDAVIGWLTAEITELLKMDGINSAFVEDNVAKALAEVRAVVARHHDLFVRDNPNFYLDLMLLVVNALLFLVIFSYPFSLIVYTPKNFIFTALPCLQPIVMIGVFVIVGSFRTAFSLLARLRNPFSWTRDRIKIDSLLASTDRAVFVLLRANFRNLDRDQQNDPRRRWLQRSLLERKALERQMARRQNGVGGAGATTEGGGGASGNAAGTTRSATTRTPTLHSSSENVVNHGIQAF